MKAIRHDASGRHAPMQSHGHVAAAANFGMFGSPKEKPQGLSAAGGRAARLRVVVYEFQAGRFLDLPELGQFWGQSVMCWRVLFCDLHGSQTGLALTVRRFISAALAQSAAVHRATGARQDTLGCHAQAAPKIPQHSVEVPKREISSASAAR